MLPRSLLLACRCLLRPAGSRVSRRLCSSKSTAGGHLRFPPGPEPAASTSAASSSAKLGDAADDDDDLLDYDEYIEYLGDEAGEQRQADALSPEAAAVERRRLFAAECPVDAGRRGRTGVVDPDELVRLLRYRNARDVVVVRCPDSAAGAAAGARPPHLVVCTGRSSRHLLGLADYTLRLYKYRLLADPLPGAGRRGLELPALEAGASPSRCNWVALDLGNCGLHCFLPDARARYDLESLWCLGPGLDPACRAAAAAADDAAAADVDAGVDWDEVARLAAEEKAQLARK